MLFDDSADKDSTTRSNIIKDYLEYEKSNISNSNSGANLIEDKGNDDDSKNENDNSSQ